MCIELSDLGTKVGTGTLCNDNGCTLDYSDIGAGNSGCFIVHSKCPNQFGLPCNQNTTSCSADGCSKTLDTNFCGAQQIDVRCTTGANPLDYVSLVNEQACGTTTPPGGSTPPTGTYSCNSRCDTDAQCQTANSAYRCTQNVCVNPAYPGSPTCGPAAAGATAQCLNIRVYDEDGNDIVDSRAEASVAGGLAILEIARGTRVSNQDVGINVMGKEDAVQYSDIISIYPENKFRPTAKLKIYVDSCEDSDDEYGYDAIIDRNSGKAYKIECKEINGRVYYE